MRQATLAEEKALLRKRMRRLRRDFTSGREEAEAAIAKRIVAILGNEPPGVVAGYWPIAGEVDIRPALSAASDRHRLCLPVVRDRDAPLVFRAWKPGEVLVPGVFSTLVPTADKAALLPDILLVPLLAFDRRGYRLGYGGGYYDRTLARLRAEKDILAIGIAFALQEAEALPAEETDRRLDVIVTEEEEIVIR